MNCERLVNNLLKSLLFLSFVIKYQTSAFKEKLDNKSLSHHWGYVDVRPGAHMFWWFFETIAQESDRPLIIWLEGGPGISGIAYSNFEEIGPYDTNLKWRNHTWIKDYNVLFVDNPVGTGFSYVENNVYCTDFTCIVEDLMTLIKEFLQKFPKFRKIPTYVFGQSYGGVYTIELANFWYQEQLRRNIDSNLKGIGLVSAALSSPDHMVFSTEYLFNLGLIDSDKYMELSNYGNEFLEELNKQNFVYAEEKLMDFLFLRRDFAPEVNIFNIEEKYDPILKFEWYTPELLNIMWKLRNHLNLTSDFNADFSVVRSYLVKSGYLFKSVLPELEQILTNSSLKVFVLNGIFDGQVQAKSTLNMLDGLKWPQKECWFSAPKTLLIVNEIAEGYSKQCGNLKYYLVLRAGHSIPMYNHVAMDEILKDLIYAQP